MKIKIPDYIYLKEGSLFSVERKEDFTYLSVNRTADITIKSAYINSVSGSYGNFVKNLSSGDFTPVLPEAYCIGNQNNKWKEIYTLTTYSNTLYTSSIRSRYLTIQDTEDNHGYLTFVPSVSSAEIAYFYNGQSSFYFTLNGNNGDPFISTHNLRKILPYTTCDLGSQHYYWNNLYVTYITANSITSSNGNFDNLDVVYVIDTPKLKIQNIVPRANSSSITFGSTSEFTKMSLTFEQTSSTAYSFIFRNTSNNSRTISFNYSGSSKYVQPDTYNDINFGTSNYRWNAGYFMSVNTGSISSTEVTFGNIYPSSSDPWQVEPNPTGTYQPPYFTGGHFVGKPYFPSSGSNQECVDGISLRMPQIVYLYVDGYKSSSATQIVPLLYIPVGETILVDLIGREFYGSSANSHDLLPGDFITVASYYSYHIGGIYHDGDLVCPLINSGNDNTNFDHMTMTWSSQTYEVYLSPGEYVVLTGATKTSSASDTRRVLIRKLSDRGRVNLT